MRSRAARPDRPDERSWANRPGRQVRGMTPGTGQFHGRSDPSSPPSRIFTVPRTLPTRDPLRHVARHQLKLGAAVLAEPRQERLDGRAVTARSGPDQPAAVVVDHHAEGALPAADRDLVPADAPELGGHIPPPPGPVGPALTDPADRAPTRAHQRRDRARRRVHRRPRRLVLKGRGEPRAVARPGHGGDDDAMAPTRHARRLGLNVGEDHAEIQRAPAPATLAPVIARTAPPADPAAAALGRAWTDADHDRVTVEQNVLDHDPRQPEQPRPYPYPAHVAPPPRWIPDLTSRNPRSAAACATPDPPLRRARVRNLPPPHQRSRPALSSTANPLQTRIPTRVPPPTTEAVLDRCRPAKLAVRPARCHPRKQQ